MSKLLLALKNGDESTSESLWPEILSYPFWQLSITDIWKLSWQVSDSRGEQTWSKALLDHPAFRQVALFFLTLAGEQHLHTAETVLDALIGTQPVETNDANTDHTVSPLKTFYTSQTVQNTQPALFYETLSHLTVIRSKLREHQATLEATLTLQDFVDFVQLYQSAGQRMINTSPYNQHAEAVQLLTVFKAKGLEYKYVFLPSVHDDVWGESSRGGGNKLTLPQNVAPIRHAGASEDERLRIFYVAITRAKIGLYLTSYRENYAGKATKRLKYLDEQEQEDGSFKTQALPENTALNSFSDTTAPTLVTLEQNWKNIHTAGIASTQLSDLLRERLKSYQLSPTHLNTFTDMEYGGPEVFFFNTLLRFPSAPGVDGQFGNAVHETMEWLQHQVDETGELAPLKQVFAYFERRLQGKHLAKQDFALQKERGEHALSSYLAARGEIFKQGDKSEHNFRSEGVFIGPVHMAGKIDRMEIDKKNKIITVVDYKTGKPHSRWESSLRLHKYKQQLYCYKLLIENSQSFKGYQVASGRLEFIEPDQVGHIHTLELMFEDSELARIKQLLQAMWQHVQALDFPDTSQHDTSLTGTKAFEAQLLTGIDS